MTPAVGTKLGTWSERITRDQIIRYTCAADDFDAIHYDDEAARSFGLPGVVAQGMLIMGILGRYLTELPSRQGGLVRFNTRFRSLVQPGDVIVMSAEVTEAETGADGSARIDLDLNVQVEGAGSPAITGTAILLIREQ